MFSQRSALLSGKLQRCCQSSYLQIYHFKTVYTKKSIRSWNLVIQFSCYNLFISSCPNFGGGKETEQVKLPENICWWIQIRGGMVINTSFPEQQERDGIIKQSALITKYFLHKKHETFTNKERIWKFKSSGGWRVGSQRSSRRQVCFDL